MQTRRKKQTAFLRAFIEEGTVMHAARRAHVNRKTHRDWVRDDPAYLAEFLEAQEHARQMLEAEARRRAIVGWDEPVFHAGKRVGTIRRKSDVLLIFMLKAARPEIYRERVEHTGKVGLKLEVDLSRYSDEQLEALERLVALGLPGGS